MKTTLQKNVDEIYTTWFCDGHRDHAFLDDASVRREYDYDTQLWVSRKRDRKSVV